MFVKDLLEKYKSEDKILELKKFWNNSYFKDYSDDYIKVVFDSFSKKRNIQYSRSTLFIDIEDIFNVYHKVYYGKITYSMSFIPWKEVFSMKIHKDSVEKYSEMQLICAIVFEITFYGNEKQTAKRRSKVYKSLKECKNVELKSLEDVIKELEI